MRLNLLTPPSMPRPEASEILIRLHVAALEWAYAQGLLPESGVSAGRLVGANAASMTITTRERFARDMAAVLLAHIAHLPGLLIVRMGETDPVVEHQAHMTAEVAHAFA